MAEHAVEGPWRMRRLVAVQAYYGTQGEELGLDLEIASGEVFRVRLLREELQTLRRLIDEAEVVLTRNARVAKRAAGGL